MNRHILSIVIGICLGITPHIRGMKLKKLAKKTTLVQSLFGNTQRAFYAKNSAVELPKNIHKMIFNPYYLEHDYHNQKDNYVKIKPNLASIALAVSKPNFSQDEALQYVQTAATCIGDTSSPTSGNTKATKEIMQPFLSYALFLAAQYKKLNDQTIDTTYAHLIDQIFRKSWIGFNEPLWNGNRMWSALQEDQQDASSPLSKAVKYDLQQLVPILFESSSELHRGALQVNIQDHKQRTPLHYVKSSAIAQLLITKGAAVNQIDAAGDTPLHYCPTPVVPLLIEHGANPLAKNGSLIMFASTMNKDIRNRCNAIIQGEAVDHEIIQVFQVRNGRFIWYSHEYRGVTPIMQAVIERDVEKVKAFLSTCPAKDIEPQLKVLRTMARCIAIDSDAGIVMFHHLQQYEEKHKWGIRLLKADESLKTLQKFATHYQRMDNDEKTVWTLDKVSLIKNIEHLMHKQQIFDLGLMVKGPEDFMDTAQGNRELAQDLYDLNKKCLFSGANQEFMNQFCNKWNIKQLSARYNKEDYK